MNVPSSLREGLPASGSPAILSQGRADVALDRDAPLSASAKEATDHAAR